MCAHYYNTPPSLLLKYYLNFHFLLKLWSHFFFIFHLFNVISLSPLLIVVIITALKQAYEDILRFKSDLEINNRSINTFRDGKLIKLNWKNIVVSIFLFFKNLYNYSLFIHFYLKFKFVLILEIQIFLL